MKQGNRISVVMATYNGGRYLREQLDSLLAQSLPFYELIIQDDGSTDETLSIVKEYAMHDGRIKLFENNKNVGWNLNFITAMRRATGNYIAICDQDDIWFREKLEKELECIGGASLCYCYRYKDNIFRGKDKCKVLAAPQPEMESLLFTSHIPGHSMLIKHELLQSIDTWHERIPYDWWLALQAHLHKGIAVVREPLNWHRPHVDSASAEMMKEEWARNARVSWQPYVFGWKAYQQFQKMEDWDWLYSYIERHTRSARWRRVNKMARLMLKRGRLALLELCLMTMIHRGKVHRRFAEGSIGSRMIGIVRGFFYPLMWTYNNNTSFIQKPVSWKKTKSK